ncbi:MAG: PBP1A family penicillin-binding protein [Spirochaetaceae bacterium]|jgi:penicillin-binding protein 1A|nr:PBP1A family penicillin-binding protein [Spirochaetaceae bacterium]
MEQDRSGEQGQNSRESIKKRVVLRLIAGVTLFFVMLIGAGLGFALAATENVINQEEFQVFTPALPTKILDIHGSVITEFSAEEKRELVALADLPKHLIYAALAREDPAFYKHRGFSIRGIGRALYGQITGKTLGGGSTITQQVAGTLYTDRREYSYSRKLRELWWAIQMERRYTKNEILEIYLNYMYMGPGVYGVEAASKYFFGHGAKDMTLAESAVLVVQLSSPSKYNPLDNPNIAMERQMWVLDKMIELGFTTREEADASYNEYWSKYDYTRASLSAYYHREDKAPWFSEYVRRELDGMMYQTMDYYRDGYTVQTTLDLSFQKAARELMEKSIERANNEYSRSSGSRIDRAEAQVLPLINMLNLHFGMNMLRVDYSKRNEYRAQSRYNRLINPIVDMSALLLNMPELKEASAAGFEELKTTAEQNVVEGALVLIENETGYIKALIGGSKYDQNNQLIRATQGRVMPGSSFKPLYYSAAIDSRKFSPSSLIYDVPIVFYNEDGTPYIPLNFRGEWKGPVLLYEALAHSMNVPSLKILDAIGFDAAIDRAAALLGINDPETKRRTFPRVYPMGLGIISIAPIQMAKAFAAFANEGKEVVPIAILSISDRNGRVIVDNERDLRLKQRQKGDGIQIISPATAYVMTGLLKKTVEMGTLGGQSAKFSYVDDNGKRYYIAAAGKTGTTQNWSDAWTVGFTPYYTSAIWYGFDKPGNSLGLNLTGATLAGPVWGDFMREVHRGLPSRDFKRPANGVTDLRVCAKSGQLLTPNCKSGSVVLSFLSGATPTEYCTYHGEGGTTNELRLDFDGHEFESWQMPTLDLDSLPTEAWFSEDEEPLYDYEVGTGDRQENASYTGLDDASPQFPAPQPPSGQNPAAGISRPSGQNTGGSFAPNASTPTGGHLQPDGGNAADGVSGGEYNGLDTFQLPDYDPLTD